MEPNPTDTNRLLSELNPAQQAAVSYICGPHLVVAGAGSGKTRVLTYKIAYLISQGIPSSSILALTFTNKAAKEMKERIYRLIGREQARYLSAGTFHSIFSRILRQEAESIGYGKDFTIYDTQDSKSVLKHIIKELGLDDKIYKPNVVLARISEAKNNLLSARDYLSDNGLRLRDVHDRMYRMADVYQIYEQRLKRANAMDFDDLLFNMNLLLSRFPDKRTKYQDIFKFILVDEYQDTNYSQYMIIRQLAEPENNICVVGDDAQSIYAFRGADIRNILRFEEEYKGCKVFKLERNYRSTKNIVGAANSLIKKNRHQIPKEVYSEQGEGKPLPVNAYSDDRDEASATASLVRQLQRNGRSLDDIAVLYRTNAQSRVLEDEMRKQSVPYRLYGGLSFYQRKEIKDVLSYFRLIVNNYDDEAFVRIINFPARKIGETTVERLRQAAASHGCCFFRVASSPEEYGVEVNRPTMQRIRSFAAMITAFAQDAETYDAYSFADKVIQESGLKIALVADNTQEGIERQQNIEELLSALREFVMLQTTNGDDPSIRAFLAEVALLTDQDESQKDDKERVTLMTIHAAKGLEYGVVIVVGLEENLFPSPFCETEAGMEEERRLFYVAVTRAKEECYLKYARQRFRNGSILYQTPSRFLKDIDSRFLQQSVVGNTQHQSAPFLSSAHSSRGNIRPLQLAFIDDTGISEKTPVTPPFPIGSRIVHATFGAGTLVDAYRENGNDKLIVKFDNAGTKTMLQRFAKLELIQ